MSEDDQYSPKLEDVFFGQKPISKIRQGCKFHDAFLALCVEMKKRAMEKTRNKNKRGKA